MKKLFLYAFLSFSITFGSGPRDTQRLEPQKWIGIGVDFGLKSDPWDHDLGTIYVPVHISPALKVEPEFGLDRWRSRNETIDTVGTTLSAGIGILPMSRLNSTVFYYGARARVIWNALSLEGNNPDSDSRFDFSVGGSLGSEHLFTENFSLGGEFQLNYKREGESDVGILGPTHDRTATFTRTMIFLRWYM